MTSRYDTVTSEFIPLIERIELLDRKRLMAYGCIPFDYEIKNSSGMFSLPRRITYHNEGKFTFSVHPLIDILTANQMFDYRLKKTHFPIKATFSLSLNEYVRNRRLAEANYDLVNGGKVTDIAFKYGYQSVDGFSRAFTKWSGLLPSEAAKQKKCISFPRFNFSITVKGGNRMECRIIEKAAFNFAGVSARVPMQFEGVNQEIVKLVQSITQRQKNELHRLQNTEPFEIVNVSYNSDTDFMKEEGYLTHLIGVLTTEEDMGEGLEKIPMKACTWAVFPNEGPYPSTLQNTYARTYSEWFLTSGYELAESLSFSFTKPPISDHCPCIGSNLRR